jgi:hypothetical protein
MRAKLMLTLAATAAAMVFPPAIDAVRAEGLAALTGLVSSEAEGKMEGVVVTARRAGSIVQVSVTTDAEGRYSFPRDRLEPGEYTLDIRAVGYDIDSPAKAAVANGKAATADIKAKTTRNLAGQLTNAEWMMSIPGTEEQKAGLLNCVGCHTLERVVRSTHDSDEWTRVISRMLGYGAVSQPIKPQPMLDRSRAGTPEQYRKLADYLATINLSAVDHWPYELKTLPRPKGRDTRAIVTQYDMVRPTTEPHDVLVDKEGKVWYTDFGEMFIGKFDPSHSSSSNIRSRSSRTKRRPGCSPSSSITRARSGSTRCIKARSATSIPRRARSPITRCRRNGTTTPCSSTSRACATTSTEKSGPRAWARSTSSGSI